MDYAASYGRVWKTRGFTLVEISVVLIVIGLLIAGVLVGQSMITASKVKAQILQISQFDIAGRNFREKYKFMPGDAPYSFDTQSPNSVGNGDGLLNDSSGFCPPRSSWMEHYMYMTSLTQQANMPGKVRTISNTREIGLTHPRAAIGRGGIIMTGNTNGDVFYWLAMSQSSGPGGYSGGFFSYHSNEGIFSPEEALAIDATIDDGKPATGLVVATTYNVNFTNGGVPYPMALDAAIDGCTASGAGYSTSRSETTLCRLLVKANIKK